jgi:2-polyprenyl-6-methoxyphenol hydroxylase-like FAD-dependent oxidoreductase
MITTLPSRTADVLVVGAGPTGLMAALVLARVGVQVEIVDPKSGPTRESRALGVQARSMELYAQLGLVDQVLAESYTAPAIELGWLDRPGRRVQLDLLQNQVSDYPGLHVFEQSRNETLLYDALREPLAGQGREVRWGERLIDLTTDDDGVHALTDNDGDLTRVHARWCIGADGATSMVRRLLDIRFDGVTYPGRFWVADVRGARGLSDGVLNLRFGTDDLMLSFPLGPGGHSRFLGAVPMTDGTEPTAEAILPPVAARYGFEFDQVDWFAHYRVHHRMAGQFRHGSVFLTGDAAHVHSPVGGQGMNTGLQDAHDLTLAIADVVAGRTDPDDPQGNRRLDRYHAERQPVARHLVEFTDRAFSLLAAQRPGRGLLRHLIASGLAPVMVKTVPRLPNRERLGGLLGQTRIRYPMPTSDDPAVGRRLPPSGANHTLLRDFSWQLHQYAGRSAGTDGRAGIDLPDWITGPHRLPVDDAGRLDPARIYLIRPDGFVAASATPGDVSPLHTALQAHGLTSGILVR